MYIYFCQGGIEYPVNYILFSNHPLLQTHSNQEYDNNKNPPSKPWASWTTRWAKKSFCYGVKTVRLGVGNSVILISCWILGGDSVLSSTLSVLLGVTIGWDSGTASVYLHPYLQQEHHIMKTIDWCGSDIWLIFNWVSEICFQWGIKLIHNLCFSFLSGIYHLQCLILSKSPTTQIKPKYWLFLSKSL